MTTNSVKSRCFTIIPDDEQTGLSAEKIFFVRERDNGKRVRKRKREREVTERETICRFLHQVPEKYRKNGLDNCYDCSSEVYILGD